MKKTGIMLVIKFYLLCSSFAFGYIDSSSAIKYGFSGGRFGDNLLAVAHAKWFSYCLGLPLVYLPFDYSDHLQLSRDSSLIFDLKKHEYSKQCEIRSEGDYQNLWKWIFAPEALHKTLITLAYYPESAYEYERDHAHNYPPYSQVNWDDPIFIQELKRLMTPIVSLKEIQLPKDRITIALHIRTGVGYDGADFPKLWPLKWCPLAYYDDALNFLWNMYQKPLYVYIFTDDPNPKNLKKMFSNKFRQHDIVFACRDERNSHNLNVVDDFFALGKFDCLIRNESNFSYMASKLFPYKVMIAPLHFVGDPKKSIKIDQILVQVSNNGSIPFLRTIVRN